MSTLYKRATPSQNRVLRIIEGAIRNAAHAHSELDITPHLQRSIAKRAAGTLTANWPDVLAAKKAKQPRSLSESGERSSTNNRPRRMSQLVKASERGASGLAKRSSLRLLRRFLGAQLKGLKATDPVKAEHFLQVLRLIHVIENGGDPFASRPPEAREP